MTVGEAALVRARAEQLGVSVPRLLVESTVAVGAAPLTATTAERRELIEELFAVHRVLAGMANNLNQVARATNATRESQPELLALMVAIRDTALRVDRTLDAMVPGA